MWRGLSSFCILAFLVGALIYWCLSSYSSPVRIIATVPIAGVVSAYVIRFWYYSISIRSKRKELKFLQGLAKKGFDGDLYSQMCMADIFLDNENPSHNIQIGINWLTMAARQGDLSSQLRLTDILLADTQIEINECDRKKKESLYEAYQWMLDAAQRGHVVAKRKLGEMRFLGLGCEQSESEAAVWFMKAADEKDSIANLWLAYLYLNGQGVPQDRVMGLTCYFIAQRTGKTDETLKEKLMNGLEEGQIRQAKTYAIEITDGEAAVQF